MNQSHPHMSTASPYSLAGSFPYYKHIVMPQDQRDKILQMHAASRANAGIYVAVVLAIYIFLLTMLLCHYKRKYPYVSGNGNDNSHRESQLYLAATPTQPNPPHRTNKRLISFKCLQIMKRRGAEAHRSPEEAELELEDVPITSMRMSMPPKINVINSSEGDGSLERGRHKHCVTVSINGNPGFAKSVQPVEI